MEYHQITIDEALKEMDSKRVFCKRCGRELKNQKAKDLGFGPACFKKYMKECSRNNRKKLFKMENGGANENT